MQLGVFLFFSWLHGAAKVPCEYLAIQKLGRVAAVVMSHWPLPVARNSGVALLAIAPAPQCLHGLGVALLEVASVADHQDAMVQSVGIVLA